MAELKTKQNDESVQAFLATVEDEQKKQDALALVDIMSEVTGEPAKMWGSSIVGFGSYHYKYASGHEGDATPVGFSPRKQALTLYISTGFEEHANLMKKLGKYKTGKGCLYIKKLTDVDQDTLKELIRQSFDHRIKNHPE